MDVPGRRHRELLLGLRALRPAEPLAASLPWPVHRAGVLRCNLRLVVDWLRPEPGTRTGRSSDLQVPRQGSARVTQPSSDLPLEDLETGKVLSESVRTKIIIAVLSSTCCNPDGRPAHQPPPSQDESAGITTWW